MIRFIKRTDGEVFSIGDEFTTAHEGTSIVNGKPSNRKMRICGFEINKEHRAIYVLFMPQYSNGKIETKNPWRACRINEAIHIK